MAILYLTEQGSLLRKKGDRLVVEAHRETLLSVESHKIDAVLIFGNVQVTTQAIHKLFQHGIELSYLSKSGRFIGHIRPAAAKNIDLRIEQFRRLEDETFRIVFSQSVVQAKIYNSLQLLRSFAYNHPESNLKEVTTDIEDSLRRVPLQNTFESLNGIEGLAARTYFKGFERMILGDFTFEGRKRRPPPDPVNALLSLGYTLVFNELASLLDGLGLDPLLGYYHKENYGRASLAADILEEFRVPLVDRLTLKLINNRVLIPEDFFTNPAESGCYLKRDALKKYLEIYEKQINESFRHPETGQETSFRKCLRIQAEKLPLCIRGERAYTPFTMDL